MPEDFPHREKLRPPYHKDYVLTGSAARTINDTPWVRLSTRFAVWTRKRLYRISNPYIGSIIKLPFGLCVKATPFTRLAEAHVMDFIRQNTSIPVPKVYAAFVHNGRTFIVMQRLAGRHLSTGWGRRSPESRKRILCQLQAMMKELCAVEPPKDFTGVANIDGGPIYDGRLPYTSEWGPFKTIDDFHRALRNDIDAKTTGLDDLPGLADLIRFHDRPGHRPVLTHGDLSSMNIIAKGDDVTGIVDWETAGWMPQYWEYTSDWHVNPQNMWWQREINDIVTPDPEALNAEAIRRQYFGDF